MKLFSGQGSVFLIAAIVLRFAVTVSAQEAELIVQTGHSGGVASMAFSPDGSTLASGGDDNTIVLWDAATGRQIRTLKADNWVESVAFAPDGRTIACGTENARTFKGSITLWDAPTGQQRIVASGIGGVHAVAFSPDGKIIAAGGRSKTVELWDVATGRLVKELTGYEWPVESIAFSPDGRLLAAGTLDDSLFLWDVASGRQVRSIAGKPDNRWKSLAFSPDGKILASGGGDKRVHLFDVMTGRELRSMPGREHGWTTRVAFSIDGKVIAGTSAYDAGVDLWSVETGEQIRSLDAHARLATSLAFSSDGRTLASGGAEGSIILWDFAGGRRTATLASHVTDAYAIAVSPDGQWLGASRNDDPHHRINIWDLASGALRKQIYIWGPFGGQIAFSSDRHVIAELEAGALDLLDTDSGAEIRTLSYPGRSATAMEFAPDGRTIAVGDSTGTVKVWEVRTGTELRSFEGNVKGDISRVAFSDNGKLVAAALADDSIKYWNIATQQLVDSFASSDSNKLAAFGKLLPRFSRENTTPDDIFQFRIGSSGKVDLYDRRSDKLLASLIALDDSDWVVTTPNGFFDTNKPLDNIQGLQWVISDEPMMPRPLDLFMRQYYQPGLLSRLMHCTRDRDPKACDREFPRVPAIGLIDRSRPTVSIGHQ